MTPPPSSPRMQAMPTATIRSAPVHHLALPVIDPRAGSRVAIVTGSYGAGHDAAATGSPGPASGTTWR
jgi:hypothetical protein